ncbi:MAG TPA: hypothetical protein VF931_01660 [Steroidobacteraceae bacterium]
MSAESRPDIARDAPQRPSGLQRSGREAVLLSIKQALVTSRLTLTEQDAGADPYNRRQGPNPGSLWALRNR